jgi:fatty-acyl-CoA synthase
MGAVLHTLNLRLPAHQLAYVINHAEDRVIIVDASLIPLLAAIRGELKTVETIIVAGEGDTSPLGGALSYEQLLADEEPGFDWPLLDERSAAGMCYTSGTTGNPKGVVYSHRSTWLHTMAQQSASCIGMTEEDRILIIVPMFHANAWGTPYGAWLAGTDMIMPQMFLMGQNLANVINEYHPTLAVGVPTIWNGLLALDTPIDFSSARAITAGGAAVSRALIEEFESRFGVTITQGWGMTETSPLAAFGLPPARRLDGHDDMYYKIKAGRVVAGVEVRVVDIDGTVLPNDGSSRGEFEIRGPWVTGSYYKEEDADRFHDGWLRTGDIGTLDVQGYMTIADRTKDVIKSGGEWISSVELENAVMAHPDIFEAAVIAVPDPKWSERPLVVVVPKPGRTVAPSDLIDFLVGRVPRWWLPEEWTFLEEIPKTSVGKFDKKVLRAAYAEGDFKVQTAPLPK